MSQQTILIVEDEPAIRDMLKFTLSASGYAVIEVSDAEAGWKTVLAENPDLILLDWMLPGMSGVDFAQKVRQNSQTQSIPIIMLTARGEEEDQVKGFDSGANDYVVKPFSPRALVARVQALLRRQLSDAPLTDKIESGKMQLDLTSHRFFIDLQEVSLGPSEFKLIYFFMTHPNRVFSRAQLLDEVWGTNVVVEDRTVDVHIRRLRKILEPLEVADYIQTIRGSGYRFSVTDR